VEHQYYGCSTPTTAMQRLHGAGHAGFAAHSTAFLAHKVAYAALLADYGRVQDATRYCASVQVPSPAPVHPSFWCGDARRAQETKQEYSHSNTPSAFTNGRTVAACDSRLKPGSARGEHSVHAYTVIGSCIIQSACEVSISGAGSTGGPAEAAARPGRCRGACQGSGVPP